MSYDTINHPNVLNIIYYYIPCIIILLYNDVLNFTREHTSIIVE